MEPSLIASQLREIAIYFDLDGDRHRALAYDRAAKSVEAATGIQKLIDEGRLEELPAIGPSIARTIGDLARRGSATVLDNLRAKWPMVIVELAQLPYVGVIKARKIHQAIAPADLDAVAAACRAGALRAIKGFGETSEAKILAAIEERRHRGNRALHMDAEEHAISIAAHLRADPAALQVEIAGPVRRWIEIVEHLAFAVATEHADAIVERFRSYALITGVERGEDHVTARLADGMRCEMYLAPPARFGWAVIRATGSPEHVELLRARGADVIEGDEREVYAKLGVPYCPPEVRDGTDELGRDWSHLVELKDLTTASHCHTTYSDGRHTILEMANAAHARGFQAITITDHSAAASYAGGLDATRLREQQIELRATEAPVRLLHGTEADILSDGTIDVPAEMIPELDLVIASVHQRFKLDEDAATARLVNAMRQPFFKIWGHALGRLVLKRDPIKVRITDVFDAIAESRAAIEINGDPHRLDLDPINARAAAERGIKFMLSTDAHSTGNLEFARWAVALARRARIGKNQVLNTLPVEELAAAIKPT
ncbi:MAG: PHP domain-containing protein [Kofleriaceae bacterium]